MTNTRTLDRDCCDFEVYSHGKVIGVFDMPKDEANQLVVKLSKKTGNRIDWHYVGGRVVMKMLPPKPTVNARHLVSRNQREGWYAKPFGTILRMITVGNGRFDANNPLICTRTKCRDFSLRAAKKDQL